MRQGRWGLGQSLHPWPPQLNFTLICSHLLSFLRACFCFTEVDAAGLGGPGTKAWGFQDLRWVRKGILEQVGRRWSVALFQHTLQSWLALWEGLQRCLLMPLVLGSGSA